MNLKKVLPFLHASTHDKLLTIEIAILLYQIRLLLKFAPCRTWQRFTRLIVPTAALTSTTNVNFTEARKIAYLLHGLSPIIPEATCLVHAVCGYLLLRRRGIPCAVRIGFMFDDAHALLGHAWVEVADQVIIGNQEDLTRFTLGLH